MCCDFPAPRLNLKSIESNKISRIAVVMCEYIIFIHVHSKNPVTICRSNKDTYEAFIKKGRYIYCDILAVVPRP